MSEQRLYVRIDGDGGCGPESSAPLGTLRAVTPCWQLAPFVSQVISFREAFAPGDEVIERVLPDGAVRVAFNLGDPPSAGASAGQAVEAIGAAAAPALVRLWGQLDGVSFAVRPGAAFAVLGVPACELAGTSADLDELWGGAGRHLLEQMALAPHDVARLQVLELALLQRLPRRADDGSRQAVRAAQLIAEAEGQIPLRRVADRLGVGERRLQQLFRIHVGLSPRAWARVSRLHGCLRALRRLGSERRPGWARLAAAAGYYDQSHLANEFRALCGLTPSAFLRLSASGFSKTSRGGWATVRDSRQTDVTRSHHDEPP